MSKLNDLIKELCPDGVEYKALGDICEIRTGNKPEKIYDMINSFEYINAGTTNSGFTDIYNCDGDTVNVLQGKGSISKKNADRKAKSKYDEFNKIQKTTSDFDKKVKRLMKKGGVINE